jgi:ribosome maturation factor RimP
VSLPTFFINGGKMEYTEFDIKNSVIKFLGEENLELYDINMVNFPTIDKIEIFVYSEDLIDYSIIKRLNYQVQRHLEDFNLFKGDYELIISTPGIERSLKTERHYELAIGESVKIKLITPINDIYTFDGELQSFDNNNVVIILDNNDLLSVDLENIKKAKIQYNKFKQKVK